MNSRVEINGDYGRCCTFMRIPPEGFGKKISDVGVMRFLNCSDQWIMDIMVADARHALWKQGLLVRRVKNVVRDAVPLRFWVPFRFVKPAISQAGVSGTSYVFSRAWLRAPFEIQFETPEEPVMRYVYALEHGDAPTVSPDSNTATGASRRVSQLSRYIWPMAPIRYSIKFRWF